MTKSTKRKKEKAADFVKPKLKLGKGKKPADNAVDTSFKARSITLPQQSISVTKDTEEPTTKRKLTLDDLLSHLKHYSPGVRKDSLQGLHELLEEHRSLIEPNLLKLVNACARLVGDEDASVRKAFHTFLAWLLPRIPRDHFAPHAPTLLLFVSSSLTHIFPEIRIDAIRVLDLLLELVPEEVVSGCMSRETGSTRGGHGMKVLNGYLGLLNVGSRFSEDDSEGAGPSSGIITQASSSTMVLIPATKATILKSFSRFLLNATSQVATTKVSQEALAYDMPVPLWYMASSFASPEAFEAFSNVLPLHRTSRNLRRDTRVWRDGYLLEMDDEDDFFGTYTFSGLSDDIGPSSTFHDLEAVVAEIERLGDTNSTDNQAAGGARLSFALCRTLSPILTSTFLDCAPSVFSPTQASSEAELDLIRSIMEITRCLYGHLLRDNTITRSQRLSAHEDLRSLLGHMAAYFPFGENQMVAQDMKTEHTLQEMNLIYCELFSLLSLAVNSKSHADHDAPATKRRKLDHSQNKTSRAAAKLSNWNADKQRLRVQEYVVRCLRGAQGQSLQQMSVGQQLTAQTYVALLPTLWWLLENPTSSDNESSTDILEAILRHATKTGTSSGVKIAATEFVARLVLLQTDSSYRGTARREITSMDRQQGFRDWLLHLPKVLWELGDKHPALSEFILLLFLRLLQRKSVLIDVETITALCIRLSPFFTIQHAIRGEVRGPYSKLKTPAESTKPNGAPSPLKRLALDVAANLVSPTFRPTQLGKIPISTRRSACSDVVPNNGGDTASRDSLRQAVEKAVLGTDEGEYWRGIAGI